MNLTKKALLCKNQKERLREQLYYGRQHQIYQNIIRQQAASKDTIIRNAISFQMNLCTELNFGDIIFCSYMKHLECVVCGE